MSVTNEKRVNLLGKEECAEQLAIGWKHCLRARILRCSSSTALEFTILLLLLGRRVTWEEHMMWALCNTEVCSIIPLVCGGFIHSLNIHDIAWTWFPNLQLSADSCTISVLTCCVCFELRLPPVGTSNIYIAPQLLALSDSHYIANKILLACTWLVSVAIEPAYITYRKNHIHMLWVFFLSNRSWIHKPATPAGSQGDLRRAHDVGLV